MHNAPTGVRLRSPLGTVFDDPILHGLDLQGDDLQRAKDEKLLEMLGEMARGIDDEEDADSVRLDMLPVEVQEEDPMTRSLLQECGALWEEVQREAEAKEDLRGRLMGELRQIQERSERQYQESSMLTQRLMGAKQALAEKLQDASLVHQELRDQIVEVWHTNEHLRSATLGGGSHLAAEAEALNSEIFEVGESQAMLVRELQNATETQAQLQAELQTERVRTWRQSADVVLAFARGTALSMVGTGPIPDILPDGTDLGAAPAMSPRAGEVGGVADSEERLGQPPDSQRSEAPRQLLEEMSAYMHTQGAGLSEQAELEQACRLQAEQIEELSKALALEESCRSSLQAQLEYVRDKTAAFGIELDGTDRTGQAADLDRTGQAADLDGISLENLENPAPADPDAADRSMDDQQEQQQHQQHQESPVFCELADPDAEDGGKDDHRQQEQQQHEQQHQQQQIIDRADKKLNYSSSISALASIPVCIRCARSDQDIARGCTEWRR